MVEKSVIVTYLLLFTGGLIGLHHVYLRRYRHAVVLSLLGGIFGFGLLYDLWAIPDYVKDANKDSYYMELLEKKMQKHSKPPPSVFSICTQVVAGHFFGFLALAAVPKDYVPFASVFPPLAVAAGVHLVGNTDREEGPFKQPLFVAYGAYFLSLLLFSNDYVVLFIISVMSTACFYYSVQWRRTPQSQDFEIIICDVIISLPPEIFYTLTVILYASLLTSWWYFNSTITFQDAKEIVLKHYQVFFH